LIHTVYRIETIGLDRILRFWYVSTVQNMID